MHTRFALLVGFALAPLATGCGEASSTVEGFVGALGSDGGAPTSTTGAPTSTTSSPTPTPFVPATGDDGGAPTSTTGTTGDVTSPTPTPTPAGDAGTDAGDPLGDLGSLFGSLGGGATPDASTPTSTATGTCGGDTPHGCYTLTAGSPDGCPAQMPEIPSLIPALPDWDLCNYGAVGPGATCAYEGPSGGSGSCVCDSGAHWICAYL